MIAALRNQYSTLLCLPLHSVPHSLCPLLSQLCRGQADTLKAAHPGSLDLRLLVENIPRTLGGRRRNGNISSLPLSLLPMRAATMEGPSCGSSDQLWSHHSSLPSSAWGGEGGCGFPVACPWCFHTHRGFPFNPACISANGALIKFFSEP